MWFIGKVQMFLLPAIICAINGTQICTQQEKIYATYKFSTCRTEQLQNWCYRRDMYTEMSKEEVAFFKETDPDNFNEYSCYGYSTSCDFLRFLTQVCGSHYEECHSEEERKPIMKMWIKQFVRRTVQSVGRYRDMSLELKNGTCNDILQEFFDKEEIEEISDMIGSYDIWNEYNEKSNITYSKMGVLVDDNGSKISIAEKSKYLTSSEVESHGLTLPSHWKYCDWKLTVSDKLPYILLDMFHCDGKRNTNKGDDQAWYHTSIEMLNDQSFGTYLDLKDGNVKLERYMRTLIYEYEPNGILACSFENWSNIYDDDCQAYKKFVQHCPRYMDRLLGNIAIREVVLSVALRSFKPDGCGLKKSSSSANYLVNSLIMNVTFILVCKAIYDLVNYT